MRTLSAVRAVHALTLRCCSMTDIQGGKPTDGSAAWQSQKMAKAASRLSKVEQP